MKFLLKLRRDRLLLLIHGVPSLIILLSLPFIGWIDIPFPFHFMVWISGWYLWLYAVGIHLYKRLPEGVNLNIARFRILFPLGFFMANLYTYFMYIDYELSDVSAEVGAIIVIGTFVSAFVLTMRGAMFAARCMKSIQLRRLATSKEFGDEVGTFCFALIGCWYLQPTINHLVNDNPTKMEILLGYKEWK